MCPTDMMFRDNLNRDILSRRYCCITDEVTKILFTTFKATKSTDHTILAKPQRARIIECLRSVKDHEPYDTYEATKGMNYMILTYEATKIMADLLLMKQQRVWIISHHNKKSFQVTLQLSS